MTTPSSRAPGQTRSYPSPTSSGHIPFTHPPTGVSSETAYWLWGDLSTSPKKPPLICLHGGPGIPHNYLLPISLVYADHGIPVLMYDQIGCGKSTHFQDRKGDDSLWNPQLFMDELNNIISHFGIQEFDLLGQSWGSMLATQYAIEQQPKGLRKLVIEGGPVSTAEYQATSLRLVKQLPAEAQKALMSNDLESEEYKAAEMQYYARHVCRVDPWPSEFLASVAQMEEDPTVYHTMMGPSELECIGNLKDWSVEKELHKITEKTCPGGLLVCNGEFDTVSDDNTEGYLWKTGGVKVRWVRYGLSSHLPMLEETERFVRDVGSFLTQM